MPTVRYSANVGGCPAALPIPAVSPEGATGGGSHVLGFPGTLAVPALGPNILQNGRLAALGFYPSNAANVIRPSLYRLVAPYPGSPRVGRTRTRPSPVPSATVPNRVPSLMSRPARIGGNTVTSNPRPRVMWPVRGRPGRFA